MPSKKQLFWAYRILFLFFLASLFWPDLLATAFAAAGGDGGHSGGHGGPVVTALLSITIILLVAKIGGDIALRFGQPEVLGELGFGLILGNLALMGIDTFEYLSSDSSIEILSELGVILLLFEVGLETNISEMAKVGLSAVLAAILGVVVPFFLGWGIAAVFVPEANTLVHVFVGATLTATSVGITARVLKDLGKIRTREAQIILGAAVIDDVLGLLVLAVVTGIITASNQGTELAGGEMIAIIVKAVGFLVAAVFIGNFASPVLFRMATFLRSHGLLLATSLVVCFGLAYLAAEVGLAPIVGAFTAGLILDEVHYRDLASRQNNATIESLIEPITALLVPIFFVVMGARVDLSAFADLSILVYALVLTVGAVIGKQICSLGVLDKTVDRIAVGFGMIPRGEVGLIFAGIGLGLSIHGEPVVDAGTYGAVVIMVILTTMVTPPLIKWKFSGGPAEPLEAADSSE